MPVANDLTIGLCFQRFAAEMGSLRVEGEGGGRSLNLADALSEANMELLLKAAGLEVSSHFIT